MIEQIDNLLIWIERDRNCYEQINSILGSDLEAEEQRKDVLKDLQVRIKTNRKNLLEVTRKHFIEQAMMKT